MKFTLQDPNIQSLKARIVSDEAQTAYKMMNKVAVTKNLTATYRQENTQHLCQIVNRREIYIREKIKIP